MNQGLEVFLVMVLFLGLLAAGMPIPFAIGVPAIAYLLLHGGIPANTISLLMGAPGSGKTIIAEQIAFSNATP